MNLIQNHNSLRPLLHYVRYHHNRKEITITLQAGKLFRDLELNHEYIDEEIYECLRNKQPFVSHRAHNADDEMLIEDAILRARNAARRTLFE